MNQRDKLRLPGILAELGDREERYRKRALENLAKFNFDEIAYSLAKRCFHTTNPRRRENAKSLFYQQENLSKEVILSLKVLAQKDLFARDHCYEIINHYESKK